LTFHRLQLPARFVRHNFYRAGIVGVNHRNSGLSQPVFQFATGASGRGKFRIRNDDHFWLHAGNQRVTKRLAFIRQTGDDNVRAQIIRVDFESSKSIVKKFFPTIQKTDSDFINTAAWILGRAECESLCARNHQWSNDRYGVIQEHQYKTLFETPENLGVHILLDSDRPKGVSIWEVN
jgi:hypothetical protein